MSLMQMDAGISGNSDFFSNAPTDFSSRAFSPSRTPFSNGRGSELLPNPSFFSNFEMPFFSFEEEISIHDSNSSRSHAGSGDFGNFGSFSSHYGDDDDDEPPMVLSDFANVSMEVGAAAFFDQLERMAAQQPLMNETNLEELGRQDFMDSPSSRQPEFSVYRITTDGHTPFDDESKSEIIYGDDGLPSEVVVYVDEEDGGDGLLPSESRMRISQQRFSPEYGSFSPRGRFGGNRRSHRPQIGGRRKGETSRSTYLTPSGSAYANLPNAGGYYDEEEMEYDDGPYGVSRSDSHSGNLEYIGGGGGGGGGGYDDEEVYSPLRRGGYGHDDHHGGGYDDHHGGYDDHHGGYGDDHDHGYSPVKKPGPFGKAKKNFKCEYAKETLYVSKTTYKFKKKCYKILKVKCKKKDGKGKKIGYKKICNEFSVTKCRKIFATKFKTKCWLVYKKKCEDIYKTKVDWVYKEKCKTIYEKECSGYGYHKQCHEVPKEICKQVPVKKEKQVKSIKCKKVPDKKCKVT